MRQISLEFNTTNETVFSTLLSPFVEVIYKFEKENTIQYSGESYSFLNNNKFMISMLLIKTTPGVTCNILIGGTSKQMFFNFNWGTDKRISKNILFEINRICTNSNISYKITYNDSLI